MSIFTGIALGCGLIITFAFIELQIYLCKKENKILGLILPAITFSFSVIQIVITFVAPVINKAPVFNRNGRLIDFHAYIVKSQPIEILMNFVVANILTIIFLGIYFSYRKRISRNISPEIKAVSDN